MLKKICEIYQLKKYIKNVKRVYKYSSYGKVNDNLLFLKKNIEKNNKGIIIYPLSVNWEPIQRPQQLLLSFAKQGYLCFFCENNTNEEYVVKEIIPNLYLINGEEKLITLLKHVKVTFLITYFLQYIFSQQFDNYTIWFDVLDRLDFMDFYNHYSKKIYSEIIDNSKLITYSSDSLKGYIKNKKGFLLPNAVSPDDFSINCNFIPEEMEIYLKMKKPIVGYFGVIENWFDFSLIKKIDLLNKYTIVIIGKVNEHIKICDYHFNNVHFLGEKKYKDLFSYAKFFNVAIIPFLINDLTNSVSPVKFYEYLTLKIPILSTAIYEMKKMNNYCLDIIDEQNVEMKLEESLKKDKKSISIECKKIINNNTWKTRTNIVKDVLFNE